MAVTTSNGDGFALYNAVKLPDINTVWTDKETYPYAAMTAMGSVGILLLGSQPFIPNAVGGYVTQGDAEGYLYDPNGLVAGTAYLNWGYVGAVSSSSDAATWTSHDILNEDGSVYLTSSDPIPLDGMNVIEWDGDTTGLVSSSVNTHYKVSDVVLSASDLVGSVIAFGSEAVVVPTEFITNGEGYASIDAYVLSCQNEGVSFFDNTFPEKGLYFINAFDAHLPFFAYPASGGDEGDDEDDDEGDTIPKEKHYCRINGTIYEVEGGTAKMGGTFCEVKSGTVLIDGTVYDFALN